MFAIVKTHEITRRERRDTIRIVIENFIERAFTIIDGKQHDDVLIAAAFLMRLVRGRANGVTARRPDVFEFTVRVIEPMFYLNDEGLVERAMSVKHDSLIGRKLKQHMEDVSIVDIQDRKKQMIDSIEALPCDIAVVEYKLRHDALSLISEGAPI
ncbi:MAG: hypothetical protein HZC06_07145 [Methylocystis sp.]|nr:hypothetical protein [Methylocystis sp.]